MSLVLLSRVLQQTLKLAECLRAKQFHSRFGFLPACRVLNGSCMELGFSCNAMCAEDWPCAVYAVLLLSSKDARCRARHTFTKHVRPILEAAGFHLDVRETQGPGHATDIVKEAELQIFDAVVAVGGDGTIFEILQVRNILQHWRFTATTDPSWTQATRIS